MAEAFVVTQIEDEYGDFSVAIRACLHGAGRRIFAVN